MEPTEAPMLTKATVFRGGVTVLLIAAAWLADFEFDSGVAAVVLLVVAALIAPRNWIAGSSGGPESAGPSSF